MPCSEHTFGVGSACGYSGHSRLPCALRLRQQLLRRPDMITYAALLWSARGLILSQVVPLVNKVCSEKLNGDNCIAYSA